VNWLSQHHPDLFEQIQLSQISIKKNNNRDISQEEGNNENKNTDQQENNQNLEEKENRDSDDDDDDEKEESKNKKDKKSKKKKVGKKVQIQLTPSTASTHPSEQKVVISLVARTKRKQSTVISGLESFPEIKLKNVAKVLGKKFSSGCSVSEKGQISIQGDFTDTLPDILITEFQIPSRAISIVRESAAPEENES